MKQRSVLSGAARLDGAKRCTARGCEFRVPPEMARLSIATFGRVLCVPHGKLEDPRYDEPSSFRVAQAYRDRVAARS